MICPIMSKIVAVESQMGVNASYHELEEVDCRETCAWWNVRFGMCSVAVGAYLSGTADHRAEVKQFMADRR